MARPEEGIAPARLFRWQMMPISQSFQNELALEPLSRREGAVLRPPGGQGGFLGHYHRGVDISCPPGTPVRLALSGTLSVPSFDKEGFGNAVQCDGARFRSTYGHLSVVTAKPGRAGVHGDLIGLSGSTGNSTGPHIHWEVFDKVLGAWVEPWTVV